MSTIDQDLDVRSGTAQPAGGAELTTARLAMVGDIEVRRLLPLRQRRSVGAWCFVDHYGPASVDGVGRSPQDITAAVDDWANERYGTVHGYRGAPLPAPPLDAVRLARKAAPAGYTDEASPPH